MGGYVSVLRCFLVLKARELLDHDERKRKQVISAHNTYIQIKAKKRNGQIKRRTVKATPWRRNHRQLTVVYPRASSLQYEVKMASTPPSICQ